ncbi:pyruvate formate lyase family protein [Enterococcus hulanensis]|uniref:Pyruvate formate lyase family protein n=1 Tax=Enterococcus hulanensis TaxID=2559929 RepID=A0ABU3EUW9_9ENTE|nr:pyruvate formate lyase family protein [Enterococcus hulanensis]MDT2598648.1 pyruvate formate lyase family protein [Enterococcus hulanensis]MDT2607847.1 pyruvate formate lyase family protein [Enterococcus hulanensis]MDT2615142.1 pyruvate formate lyase family protein [Enterococcus hulanensis]MDT2626887.1 pyruvate formate lyase family protein [Enterococcus hulanensis]MDT2654214.1 pyruvate formate lyase family protein [Enterococcus hulanensis]
MKKASIAGVQNVEVSIKLPSEKTPKEQLEIMEAYTQAHKDSEGLSKEAREINCLKVIYPTLFRSIEPTDLVAGRLDFLPIGFGCVTSLGGVGHYCVFDKLAKFKNELDSEEDKARVDDMYEYWEDHDVKALYCGDVLQENIINRFIDGTAPLMATARLSGMMLDYPKLLDNGIEGLKELVLEKQKELGPNEFLQSSIDALNIYQAVCDRLRELVNQAKSDAATEKRLQQLEMMENDLKVITYQKPQTFHQALQMVWVYALLAGCINYGRLDDYLGPYLKRDLDNGLITEEDAYDYLKSLWTLIENRRTTVNGRIIVGGYGRKNPEAADIFAKIAMRVTKDCKYVEPQFTLRFNKDTPEEIMDLAYDCIGAGATYPTLYNDEVNVPAVMHGMRVDRKTAEQYVPFGCGEFVIQGQSVGTPNTLLNLLMLLNMTLNEGVDPMDGIKKSGPVPIKKIENFESFDDLYANYKELLDYYFDLSVDAQYYSYELMNREVSFMFASILMDDCISRGKAILDGGIRYLGGTNETYGNINSSDALYAIKKLVFDEKKYTLKELNEAAKHNFAGYEAIREELWSQEKYGNDLAEVDELANDLYEFVANGIRDRGIEKGMQYYLIVISNNQTNTEWGRATSASLDGRYAGQFMNPANNPQGGAAQSGPTAVLNSLATFDAKYHGGAVQNIKFTPNMFNKNRTKIKYLFNTYFKKGGCHLMVTIVDHGILEDAQKHPEKYPNLIVRVSGFSAIFVNLDKDVQDELLSRTLYDE